MMIQKKKLWIMVGAAVIAAIPSSCIAPPPPSGRVIVAGPHERVGYYVYGRHGRRHFVAGRWVRPRVGIYVEYLPEGYSSVIVRGVPYYYFDGVYFRSNGPGYVVVTVPESDAAPADQPPSPTAAPQAAERQPLPSGEVAKSPSSGPSSDTVTVSVPNSKGGFTPVKLVKRDGGYVGPQGEFYSGHPTVDELKALYGN
jgi:hypothetical protein